MMPLDLKSVGAKAGFLCYNDMYIIIQIYLTSQHFVAVVVAVVAVLNFD